MPDYNFYCPIQVRYGDLDPQWHVNNAKFQVYLEQARFAYLIKLGLFDGHNYLDLGLIVADVHISFLAPIELGQNIRVGVRTARIGNKSMTLEYQIEDTDSKQVLAKAETVMVAYDYHLKQSTPVSDHWREVIHAFEGQDQAS